MQKMNGIFSIFKGNRAAAAQPAAAPAQTAAQTGPPQDADGYGGPATPPDNLAAAATMLLGKKEEQTAKLNQNWKHNECLNYVGPGAVDTQGNVYTYGTTGPRGDHFICMSPTGNKKWETFAADGTLSGRPILDDRENLYQGHSDGTLRMLDKDSGAELSSIKFGNSAVRPFKGNDGQMYIECDSRLYTIDATTGQKKFYADFSGKGEWPVVGADGTVAVVSGEHTVTAIDPRQAKVKWSIPVSGMVRCEVAVGPDGTVYAPSTDGNLYALNGSDGSQKWAFKTNSYCLTPPAVSPDGIYQGSCDHNVYSLDPATGKEFWRKSVKGEVRVNPMLDPKSGVLGIASDRNILFGIDPVTGDTLYEQPADSYMHFPPVFGEYGEVYISCNNSTLYSFQGSKYELKGREERIREDAAAAVSGRTVMEIDNGFIAIDGMKLQIKKDRKTS